MPAHHAPTMAHLPEVPMPEFLDPEKRAEPIRPLTPRQVQVAQELARGRSYRDVGRALGMKPRTVRMHVAAIALLLPNPDALPAGRLVTVWAVSEYARDSNSRAA